MDAPLRQKTCRTCHRLFAICVACDRGHAYCSDACRRAGRRRSVAAAKARHQASREGRLDHRDHQRAYRGAPPRDGSDFPGPASDATLPAIDAPARAAAPRHAVLRGLRSDEPLGGAAPSGGSRARRGRSPMITPEQHAEIRRLYFGEHWKVGTIATNLGVHHDTVRAAIALDTRAVPRGTCRRTKLDPYLPFIRETLEQYPAPAGDAAARDAAAARLRRLRGASPAARARAAAAGHRGRCTAAWSSCRPKRRRSTGAASGRSGLATGRACSPASSWCCRTRAPSLRSSRWTKRSRASCAGTSRRLARFSGAARTLVYDNLKSAVLERHGTAIRFHPRLLELAGPLPLRGPPLHAGTRQ